MAQNKTQKIAPRLKDFHFSEKTGFILPEPLEVLPEYYEPWNKLNRELADLVKTHKLRAAVDQLPELDASLLVGYRQLRLAHTILSFVTNGYIWQDGAENIPAVLPRQLAVPFYTVSERVGMRPSVCLATISLSNSTPLDPSKPLALGNMKIISKITDDEPAHWFFHIFTQSELDSVEGIKAVVAAMDAILDNDIETVCSSLEVVTSTFHTLKNTMARMGDKMPNDYFFPKLAPFLSGYGGKGTKHPEGIIFEGVSETPVVTPSGSGGQSTSVQAFDVALGLHHGEANKYLDQLRTYMPPAHRDFIKALAEGPSIKDYVSSSDDAKLKQLYADCITAIRDFRSYHIESFTKYVLVPARQQIIFDSKDEEPEALDAMAFLKSVRDSSVVSN